MKRITKEQIRNIRLLALDSDGVLTDGGIYISSDGSEFRRFSVKDGMGITRVLNEGIAVAIISNSPFEAVKHRASNLGVHEVHLGVSDKLSTLREICDRLCIESHQIAYVGDDITDISVFRHVGLSFAPSNAHAMVHDEVTCLCGKDGGDGAVREVCDLLTNRFIDED